MLFFLSLFTMDSFAVPQTLSQQGRLMDNAGSALDGMHNLTFRIFESPSATTSLWTESLSVFFENGYYNVVLGSDISNPLDVAVFEQDPLYLELQLNNESPFLPRQKLHSQTYAQIAKKATSVEGGSVNATQIQVGGSVVIDSDGTWVGPTVSVSWGEIQDIPEGFSDGIDNDTQLSESEVENMVTNGPLDFASGSTIDGKSLQEAISCQEGEILRWDGLLERWDCGLDDVLSESDVLGYVTDNSIDLAGGSSVDGKDIVGQSSPCSEGQILVYDFASSSWACGEDKDTDTQLTADQIVTLLTDRALQLASGTTVDGSAVLTEASSLEWNQLSSVPTDIADGDDKGIDMTCADGEILTSNGGVWECSPFNTVIDADSDGYLTWNDCDDSNPDIPSTDQDCDGVLTDDDCNDLDPSSTIKENDADCDSILEPDDCNDEDASSTIKENDADCDGVLTADDCDDSDNALTNYDGGSTNCAATSCKEILDNGFSSGDGTYYITAGTSGAFPVYCDMTTDSGGWTMILMVKDNDINTFKYDSSYWTSTTLLNESISNPSTDDNMKNQAYHSLSVSEIRLDLANLGNSHTISISSDSAYSIFNGSHVL